MRRHEALRTTFALVEAEPVQVIREPAPLRLQVIDLGTLATDEREAETKRLIGEEAQRPFDLAQGPRAGAEGGNAFPNRTAGVPAPAGGVRTEVVTRDGARSCSSSYRAGDVPVRTPAACLCYIVPRAGASAVCVRLALCGR